MIASGVRSSWEALAANLCCSATCASSRVSMVSKASASSRNSSLRPGSRIRWESDPVAAMRVASVMRVRGRASGRREAILPGDRNQQERQHDGRGRSESAQEEGVVPGHQVTDGADHTVGYVSQEELKRLPGLAGEPRGGEHQGTCKHEEPGVAQGELEANAQTRRPIQVLLTPGAGCCVDAVADAGHGGDDPGFAEAFAQSETVMRTALVNGSAFSSHARARSSSALTTPPSAATRTSSTANCFRVSAT